MQGVATSDPTRETMRTTQKMAGKRVLVTGSGTGIGREIALEFGRQGADVVFHFAHDAAGAQLAAKEIQALGLRAKAFQADFDRVDEVVKLGDQAVSFLGGIDCLVNNAGITFNQPFLDVRPEQFDRLYHVNIRAQFFLTQRIVKDMLQHGGGTVCNITSIHAVPARRSIQFMLEPKAPSSLIPARWPWNWRTRASELTPLPPAG